MSRILRPKPKKPPVGISKRTNYKLGDFTAEFIDTIPKVVDSNGCWIPIKKPSGNDGYVQILIDGEYHQLHRIVICIYYNLNYCDESWVSRHAKGCDKRCFFHEHLQPGTPGDNVRDSVEHGTHAETRKTCCPKCGGEYRETRLRSGFNRGKIQRYCPQCKKRRRK